MWSIRTADAPERRVESGHEPRGLGRPGRVGRRDHGVAPAGRPPPGCEVRGEGHDAIPPDLVELFGVAEADIGRRAELVVLERERDHELTSGPVLHGPGELPDDDRAVVCELVAATGKGDSAFAGHSQGQHPPILPVSSIPT